jgi:tetratricopeptide (TPR) repeat protein
MNRLKIMVLGTLFLCFALLGGGLVLGADAAEGYGNTAGYLDSIYGIDDNAGLTAFPVLNIPLGGRSEGMAQAFSAVCDDISFLELNPAGSAMLARSELAFFHNNWIADTKIEGAAYAARLGNFGFAGGAKWLYTPFTEYNIYGERVSNGYYSEAVAILNASYNLFSGYYFGGVSLGMSLKGAFRFMPDYTDNNDTIIADSGWSQSAGMVMADVGALTRFDLFKFYNSREKNSSAALVVRNLGPPALDEPLPTVISGALSYKPLRPLVFAFDASFPLNMLEPELSEKPYFAFGTSVNVTGFLSMRGGILFKAGSSRLAVGSAVTLDKIALDVNYTLDLLTQLQPLSRVSIGLRLDLGDQGRQQASDLIDDLYLKGLEAYAHGRFEEAKNYWIETLRLNPRYDPARESLEMLLRRQLVEQHIDEMQRLDF